MRQPTPVTEILRYPVTGGLCLLAIIVNIAAVIKGGSSVLQINYLAFHGEPWRLVTNILPHANGLHLIFNLYWTWAFGTVIEKEFGPLLTALLVLVVAVGGSAAQYALDEGGIGLSGVVYGLFGFLWVLSRLQPRYADDMDRATIILLVAWFFFCIVTTELGIWPIANVEHGVGAVLGAIAGFAVGSSGARRIAAGAVLLLLVGASVAAADVWRPYVNFSKSGSEDVEVVAESAMEKDDNERAADLLRLATRYRYAGARPWYNLGIAFGRLDRPDEAISAFRRAIALDPQGLIGDGAAYAIVAKEDLTKQNNREAADYFQHAIDAGQNDSLNWVGLSIADRRLGRIREAAKALKQAVGIDHPPSTAPAGASQTQPFPR